MLGQRRREVILRHIEERNVLPANIRDASTCTVRRGRVHRSVLQPSALHSTLATAPRPTPSPATNSVPLLDQHTNERLPKILDAAQVDVTDATASARKIRDLVRAGDEAAATAALPVELPYARPAELAARVAATPPEQTAPPAAHAQRQMKKLHQNSLSRAAVRAACRCRNAARRPRGMRRRRDRRARPMI